MLFESREGKRAGKVEVRNGALRSFRRRIVPFVSYVPESCVCVFFFFLNVHNMQTSIQKRCQFTTYKFEATSLLTKMQNNADKRE